MSRSAVKHPLWIEIPATINTDATFNLVGTPLHIQVAPYAQGYFLILEEYDAAGELEAITEISAHRTLDAAKRRGVDYARTHGMITA